MFADCYLNLQVIKCIVNGLFEINTITVNEIIRTTIYIALKLAALLGVRSISNE